MDQYLSVYSTISSQSVGFMFKIAGHFQFGQPGANINPHKQII